MFNPLNPQLALAGATHNGAEAPQSNVKAGVSAMLSGVRGRAMGRGAAPVSVPATPAPAAPASPPPPSPEPTHNENEVLDALEVMAQAMTQMQNSLETVRADVSHLKQKGNDSERVFNVLHNELGDYKRDFVFEHVKPLLRPLLFVFDSLDDFDKEMVLYQTDQESQTLAPDALKATKVRENIAFVRDQLEQALASCDVEPLPAPSGRFDGHEQKAVATVAVAPEQDGTIQSIERQGWTLKGHVLRPTEVVVGKAVKGE
ncbi:nucleotide exchange factor GrpE [bacterium]|nr:MAG: nucleotide exchange factor GrpE [bacterium]